MKSYDKLVHKFITGIQELDGLPGFREPKVRASSFPYCPILYTLQTPLDLVDYRSDYYFAIGTAMHELIQKWISRYTSDEYPKVYGNWKCTGCGAEEKHQTKPAPCKHCTDKRINTPFEWTYVEIELAWKYFSGHVDTILEVAPGKYVVVDYKTMTIKLGWNPLALMKKYPIPPNVKQIEVYCCMLKQLLGLDIVGWSLVYLDRSKPLETPKDYCLVYQNWTPKKHKKQWRIMQWANRTAGYAKTVKYAIENHKSIPNEAIDLIVENRPCHDMKSWKGWMRAGFYYAEKFQQESCPLLEACTSSDKKCKAAFKKSLRPVIDLYHQIDIPKYVELKDIKGALKR